MQPMPSDLLSLISTSLISSHLRPGPLSGLLFPHSHRKLPCIYLLSRMFHVPHSSILHRLYHPYNTEEAKIMQVLIMQFSPSCSSAPFSRTPYGYVLPVKFHSHTTQTASWKYCLCYKRSTCFVWVMNGLLRYKNSVKITFLKSDNGL